jgi:type II secretory pathway predicted ATPase ExeA
MLDVYKTCYQLDAHPFRLSPDHHFSFAHRSYENAKAYLKYAISEGEGIIVITGGPGTGKTTLIGALLAELDKTHVQVASLNNIQLDSRHLVNLVIDAFDLRLENDSDAGSLSQLEKHLKQHGQRGRRALLIVDEAQGLSTDALEELRLLSNLQHDNRLLLQVFLVGQEKLLEMIHAPGMEQLHQRVIAASHLEPLGLDETVSYVEHRLCDVGWEGDPAITEGALRLIHKFSGGVPRRINLICHRLFLYGGLQHKNTLDDKDAQYAIEELQKEQLLPLDLSDQEQDDAAASVQARESDAPALHLPRTESVIRTDKSRPLPIRAAAESPIADIQPRPVPPRLGMRALSSRLRR